MGLIAEIAPIFGLGVVALIIWAALVAVAPVDGCVRWLRRRGLVLHFPRSDP